LTGAPKVRAMELIDEFEPVFRGPYGGAVGYFSLSGNADFAITIRTVSLRGGVATVQAGGGVVADSQPEFEYEESINKASAPLLALEIADPTAPVASQDLLVLASYVEVALAKLGHRGLVGINLLTKVQTARRWRASLERCWPASTTC
jgi:hypothetical protein